MTQFLLEEAALMTLELVEARAQSQAAEEQDEAHRVAARANELRAVAQRQLRS